MEIRVPGGDESVEAQIRRYRQSGPWRDSDFSSNHEERRCDLGRKRITYSWAPMPDDEEPGDKLQVLSSAFGVQRGTKLRLWERAVSGGLYEFARVRKMPSVVVPRY